MYRPEDIAAAELAALAGGELNAIDKHYIDYGTSGRALKIHPKTILEKNVNRQNAPMPGRTETIPTGIFSGELDLIPTIRPPMPPPLPQQLPPPLPSPQPQIMLNPQSNINEYADKILKHLVAIESKLDKILKATKRNDNK